MRELKETEKVKESERVKKERKKIIWIEWVSEQERAREKEKSVK